MDLKLKHALFYGIVWSIILISSLSSCNSKRQFNSDVWKLKPIDHFMDPYREQMSEDLIQSHILQKKSKQEVIDILGLNERQDEAGETFFYHIIEKYGLDIDPLYRKYLSVEFDRDSVIKYYITKVE